MNEQCSSARRIFWIRSFVFITKLTCKWDKVYILYQLHRQKNQFFLAYEQKRHVLVHIFIAIINVQYATSELQKKNSF